MEELKDFESASYQPQTITPAQRYDFEVLVSIKAHPAYMAVRFGIPHQGESFFNFAGEVDTARGDPFRNPYLIAAPPQARAVHRHV